MGKLEDLGCGEELGNYPQSLLGFISTPNRLQTERPV